MRFCPNCRKPSLDSRSVPGWRPPQKSKDFHFRNNRTINVSVEDCALIFGIEFNRFEELASGWVALTDTSASLPRAIAQDVIFAFNANGRDALPRDPGTHVQRRPSLTTP
jgi:hypothetical protein